MGQETTLARPAGPLINPELRDGRLEEFSRRACFDADGNPYLYVAPNDHAAGRTAEEPPMKKGETAPGWRCWLCGKVEWNQWLLGNNHGLHAHWPWSWAKTECTSQMLKRAHREYDERMERERNARST